MKNKLAYRFATALATMAAVMVTTTASLWYINQPEVPAELLKK